MPASRSFLVPLLLAASVAALAQTPPAPSRTNPSTTAPSRPAPQRPPASAAPNPAAPAAPKEAGPKGPAGPKEASEPEQPVVTHHTITLNGKPFAYTVTTGYLPLKNPAGETQARIFFMAYTADRPEKAPGKRPLMFSFNGGPGSSSVWLHLGAIGPRRVALLDDGQMPPPPYRVVDNEATWLDRTDVVFIDPVGTGFSQAAKPEENRNYWGVREDIQSIGDFVRLYLTRYERWDSPLFLVGESYGTFRAAGLAQHLLENGIALNGVILLSTTLNMGRISPSSGDDTSYALVLPTYAATAWYHKRLPADLQARSLEEVLHEVEGWAMTGYLQALATGTALTPEERGNIVDRLARYTGLSRDTIDAANMRISSDRFFKEFAKASRRVLGRYDTRFTGADTDTASSRAEYDPSYAAVYPPFTMAFNTYLREELGYRSDREYGILENVWPWNYGQNQQGPPSTSDDLRQALTQNPYLRVLVGEGYYDLATPYFTVEYTLDHMGLTPAMRARITTARYMAGHMMYIDTAQRRKLTQDVDGFLDAALAPKSAPDTIRVGP